MIMERQTSIAAPGGQQVGWIMIIEAYGRDHLAGQGDGELDHVRRPAAGQHLDRFRNLQGVSGSEAQGNRHISEQRNRGHPLGSTEIDHGLRQLARRLQGLHESARADLDVQHQGRGTRPRSSCS